MESKGFIQISSHNTASTSILRYFRRGGEDKTPHNENTEVWSGENKLEADVNVNVTYVDVHISF